MNRVSCCIDRESDHGRTTHLPISANSGGVFRTAHGVSTIATAFHSLCEASPVARSEFC